ncbi:MAG: cell wall-binding repeat-containing protein, partial [Caldicoprobacter oshimai]
MKRRLSILLALVFLFTAVIGASGVAVYAAEDENRIAGDDRYETAAKIAAAKYTSADTVIIVRGDDNEKNEPEVVDGLTASVLAGAKNAPILLTRQNALPDATKEAIEALGAKNAYIIGGTVAVSEDVEKALEDLGVAVKRVEGADRFATA